jgi:Na+/H+ antiporter NhaD/arsenite permease-like protein
MSLPRHVVTHLTGFAVTFFPMRLMTTLFVIFAIFTSSAVANEGEAADAAHTTEKLGDLMNVVAVAPFALLLLSIALFPLLNPHWWEHNKNKGIIVAVLGLPVVAYLLSFGHHGLHALEHAGKDYVSFLILLGSLFVISGGIYVKGALHGSPTLNTMFLGLGALIASIVGTTGASMLLIRPLLRANARRHRIAHVVVFFIFVVSNCGGLLTPLGDPPLFLGFLAGVPFEWTLRLFPQWAVVNATLLVLFFIWDSIAIHREAKTPEQEEVLETPITKEPFGIEGKHNFLGLAAIVAIIFCCGQGYGNPFFKSFLPGKGETWPFGVQETLMVVTALLCYLLTSHVTREKNRFGLGPIIEVAVLFAGIFMTMIPALAILNVKGASLGVNTPAEYFWASGILSSFLDNAPTYLTFAVTACGMHGVNVEDGRFMYEFLNVAESATTAKILAAISCGSVFMGANTYIGNGPNFMVKAIAEENNVKMPGFFGYMLYSIGILIPIFILVTFLFFV